MKKANLFLLQLVLAVISWSFLQKNKASSAQYSFERSDGLSIFIEPDFTFVMEAAGADHAPRFGHQHPQKPQAIATFHRLQTHKPFQYLLHYTSLLLS